MQHELFPATNPGLESVTPAKKDFPAEVKAAPPPATIVPDEDAAEEAPASIVQREKSVPDAADEQDAAQRSPSVSLVVIPPVAAEERVVAPWHRRLSLAPYVPATAVCGLLLGVAALAVGIHVARSAAAHAPAVEEDALLAKLAGIAAGVAPGSVVVDGRHQRLQARAAPIAGADLSTYQLLERRVGSQAPGWRVTIVPPLQLPPVIRFAAGSDDLGPAARRAVIATAWAARRWGMDSIGVPGFMPSISAHPLLPQRRAQAVASLLASMGIRATPAPAEGPLFRLHLPWPR